jgi:hypothetical protein
MLKSRTLTAFAISTALFSLQVAPALADANPTPSPTFDSYKAAQEQYKKDRDVFMATMRDREMQMRAINTVFKNSVDKATADAKTAMATATTPEQKNSINTARRATIAAAIVARDSAIAALGPVPTPPIEPQRPMKIAPQGMGDQKGKQKR